MYIQDGWIRQAPGDGRPFGDTAHRHGWLETADKLRFKLDLPDAGVEFISWHTQGLLYYKDAVLELGFPSSPVRCPLDSCGPKDFSRDQLIPNLIAMQLTGYSELGAVKQLISKGRAPNGDLITAQVWNLLNDKPSILGLWELFLNSIICSLKVRINQDDTDQTLNTFCMFAFMFTKFPDSRILKLTRLVFKHLHTGVSQALRSYFRPDMGGNPELAEVWVPVVEEILK